MPELPQESDKEVWAGEEYTGPEGESSPAPPVLCLPPSPFIVGSASPIARELEVESESPPLVESPAVSSALEIPK